MNASLAKDIQHAIEAIFLKTATDDELEKAWKGFIEFCYKFWDYSEGNKLLIYWQKPEATFVMPFGKWKKVGRYVKKGEKGIKVIFPRIFSDSDGEEHISFGVGNVFDVSQTDGKPFEPAVVDLQPEQAQKVLQTLMQRVMDNGLIIEQTEAFRRGAYKVDSSDIQLSTCYNGTEQLKTLLHEYTHHIQIKWEQQDSKKAIKRDLMEVEAELSAYVLSKQLGFDTKAYSLLYIKSYSHSVKNMETIKLLLNRLNKITKQIFSELRLANIVQDSENIDDIDFEAFLHDRAEDQAFYNEFKAENRGGN